MTALLELPDVRERVQGLSVEGYHRLGELGILGKNVELLRGIVIAKMPKSPLHELVAQKLMKQLLSQVPAGFEARPERALTLRDSEPEPDLSVVQGQPDDWVTAHLSTAQLVIEVSVSSRAVDESKAEIYAEAGIAEYWLVRPEDRVVDVYSRPTSGGYFSKVTLSDKESLHSASVPGVSFPIVEILPPVSISGA